MNLPHFSVRRPVLTTMVTFIVVMLGAVSLLRIRVDLLPNIELPTLTVRTGYEGASPEVMERMVTQYIEEIISTVPGVEEITSQSSQGNSNVRVRFAWGTDLDTAALDVRGKLEDEIDELPDDIVPPRVNKFDIAGFPIVILGISSKLDPVELTELIETQLRYRFARIPGVAQVDMWGEFNREIRVEIVPDRIRALNLSLNHVLAALRDANLDLPMGKIDEGRYEVTLRAPAEFSSIDDINNTVVAMRDGAAITIGHIADVRDTHEELTRIARVNGERGLRVAIRKQADANTVEVSRRVLEEIEAIHRSFPQIDVVPVMNQGNFIERSISNVANSVLYGGGLAILVLILFLLSVRSAFVISLAIPISIVATFALMFLGGMTLNLMTLGGLALGVGMMVDSSIVVLDNIFRRRDELGESIEVASVKGASEVGPAILASTITTLVVFLPLVFVRGVSGLLFQDFAYVIVFSLVCSLLVSLSLVPMLSTKILRRRAEIGTTPSTRWETIALAWNQRFEQFIDRYRALLQWTLRYRALTIVSVVAIFGASLAFVPFIGTEFLPPSDEGEVRVTGEMEIGTRLDLVDAQTKKMEAIVYATVPEAIASVATVGASGRNPNESSIGEITLTLVEASKRDRSNVDIAARVREQLEGKIPGMEIRTRAPQGQFLLERILGTDEGITVEIRGYDLNTLDRLANAVANVIKEVKGITDVKIADTAGVPQQSIRIDREKIADLGFTVRDVTQMLETAMAGTQAGEFRTEGTSHRIFVQLKNAKTLALDDVLDLMLTSPRGEKVLLRNLVTTESGKGPILIDRKDQQRLTTVKANYTGRDLGSIASEISDRLAQIPRAKGYDLQIAGNFEEQQESSRELLVSLILALLLVYMVLASQYESFRDPLVVMLSVPLAAIGVLLTLFFTGTTLNVQSYIGCIMLGGIVVNNAILLVDQTGILVREGYDGVAAVVEAGRRRLRPILMTTLTTLLGLFPLALGIGEGADAQAPLARAVIGGLIGSTPITLILIPVVYTLVHRRAFVKR